MKVDKYYTYVLTGIVLLTAIVFSPVLDAEFTNWDDGAYILNNNLVTDFSTTNLAKIFKQKVVGSYTPFTVLSFSLDHRLWGNSPKMYHLENLLLHLCNVLLIFLVLQHLWRNKLVSLIVSLLFAIHPMHVESVSWISQRKDLLYTMFFLTSMFFYLKYVFTKYKKWMWLSLIAFIISCFSKAQAITLPAILLLLDYVLDRKFTLKVFLEKTPFVIVGIGFGFYTILSVSEAAPSNMEMLTSNVLYSVLALGIYVYKVVLPVNLAAHYPFPDVSDVFKNVGFYIGLVAIVASIGTLIARKRISKNIVFGVLFFLLNLLPMLHLIAKNTGLVYDRFSYLSYTGLFIIFAVFYEYLISKYKTTLKYFNLVVNLVFLTTLISLIVVSFNQTKVWKSSETLWNNVIDIFPSDHVAYLNRGSHLTLNSQTHDQALSDFNEAIKYDNTYSKAYLNRGALLLLKKDYANAEKDFTRTIHLDPNNYTAWGNRCNVYLEIKEFQLAINDCNKAIELNNSDPKLFVNLGNVYSQVGDFKSAIKSYDEALKLDRTNTDALLFRAQEYMKVGKYQSVIDDMSTILSSSPNNSEALYYRAGGYAGMQRFNLAYRDVQRSKELGYNVDMLFFNEMKRLSGN